MKLIGIKAKKAFKCIANTKTKNIVLINYAQLIEEEKEFIILQNLKDIKFAKKIGLKKNLINRLKLNEKKIGLEYKIFISKKECMYSKAPCTNNFQTNISHKEKYGYDIIYVHCLFKFPRFTSNGIHYNFSHCGYSSFSNGCFLVCYNSGIYQTWVWFP